MKNVFIVRNDHEDSKRCERLLREKFNSLGVGVNSGYTEDTKLIICIGGDGTFLRSVHSLGFPEQNIVGINTWGMGFFQEINTGELDNFIEAYVQGRYSVQTLQCLQASIAVDKAPDSKDARMQKYGHAQLNGEDNIVFNCESEDEKKRVFKANFLNEITVKSVLPKPVHIDIYIGNQFIETFSGDGILAATSAGSTGYNYSLGGAIMDPRLSNIQLTPIAPISSTAYRAFTSSLLLPESEAIKIVSRSNDGLVVAGDGFSSEFKNIKEINIELSPVNIKLLRFENYEFWAKAKNKFLIPSE